MEGMGSYYRGETLTEFAPSVPFRDLDLSGPRLADQFYERMMGFYLTPAKVTAEANYAFAAGLLVVASIDAMAKLAGHAPATGKRFVSWMTTEVPSFMDENLAKLFYQDFRNGLVHECQIKNGGRFSLSTRSECVVRQGSSLSVNVKVLIAEVEAALKRFIVVLKSDAEELRKFSSVLERQFSDDLAVAKQERRAS